MRLNPKKLIVVTLLKAQKTLGIFLASRLSSGKSYIHFAELFLSQNAISKSQKKNIPSRPIHSFKPELMEVGDSKQARLRIQNETKKIVIFGPQWYGPRPSFTMNQLKDSAHRVGYEVQYVDFISMLSPSNRNVDSIRELFEDALRNIKPDLVLFGSSDSYVYPFFKGINPEFVTEMRKSLSKSFSLVNVCGDLWRKADQESIQNWSEACNLFLHLDEYSMNRLSNRVREKALFYPFIGLNEFPARNRDRDYILFYSGQVRDSDRRIILNRVLKKFAQTNVLDINFKVHFSWTEKSALTELEYQQNMSNSDFCLSFAQKGPDHFLIPWRSLEALSAGCTLIHQEHPEFKPLSRIAVPFQHYLSFQNEVDLLNLLNEIKSNPASYREIGRKARLFWRERYSDWDLWNSINNKLENDLGL